MTYGASIFLIAIGAILRYAVTDDISGVDLSTIGLILMIAGGLALLITLFLTLSSRAPDRPGREAEGRYQRQDGGRY